MNNKKIVVHLSGGLGNQLFQFAAGYSLAIEQSRSLHVNTNWFDNPWFRFINEGSHQNKRRLDVLEFKAAAEVSKDRVKTPSDGRLERWLQSSSERNRRFFGMATELSFTDNGWVNASSIRRIVGYFMSPKYFTNLNVRELFSELSLPLSSAGTNLREEVEKEISIGVHVRLGDYLKSSDILVPSEKYFIEGINLLKTFYDNSPRVLLFTDDPNELRARFPSLCKIGQIIYPTKEITSTENLLSLAGCSSFVCSNSTFSWWGAELSGAAKGMIVRPSYFYDDLDKSNTAKDLWSLESHSLHPITGSPALL